MPVSLAVSTTFGMLLLAKLIASLVMLKVQKLGCLLSRSAAYHHGLLVRVLLKCLVFSGPSGIGVPWLSTKVYLLKIKKWCYINDLFPKEGGKHD